MNPETLKQKVRDVYAEAVRRDGGCCGKTESAPIAIGPGGARSSFGCGDPLTMAEIRPGQTVLDVGSGPGIDALAAAQHVGPEGRVIGVDMTEAMLDKARDNAARAGRRNVEFRRGDAESLPVDDASVDWIISNCVINLVPDKSAAFREMFRVLKPGGRLSITDLVGEDLPREVLEDPGKYCACIGGAPSEAAYLEAARVAGFEQVRVVDRFAWEAPELAGTSGKVWSIKVAGRRPSQPAAGAEADAVVVQPAGREDLPAIEALVARCGLPVEGIRERAARFLVARCAPSQASTSIVGCSGLEVHGSSCVLRSLAVAPEARGTGLARRLIEATLGVAREAGCSRAYLLTHSIEAMARRHGFERISRDAVPEEVLASREFSLTVCSSAIVMHRNL